MQSELISLLVWWFFWACSSLKILGQLFIYLITIRSAYKWSKSTFLMRSLPLSLSVFCWWFKSINFLKIAILLVSSLSHFKQLKRFIGCLDLHGFPFLSLSLSLSFLLYFKLLQACLDLLLIFKETERPLFFKSLRRYIFYLLQMTTSCMSYSTPSGISGVSQLSSKCV